MVQYLSTYLHQYKGFFLIELMVTLCIVAVGLSGTYGLLARAAQYGASSGEIHRTLDMVLNEHETVRIGARPSQKNHKVSQSSGSIAGVKILFTSITTHYRAPNNEHSLTLTLGN